MLLFRARGYQEQLFKNRENQKPALQPVLGKHGKNTYSSFPHLLFYNTVQLNISRQRKCARLSIFDILQGNNLTSIT